MAKAALLALLLASQGTPVAPPYYPSIGGFCEPHEKWAYLNQDSLEPFEEKKLDVMPDEPCSKNAPLEIEHSEIPDDNYFSHTKLNPFASDADWKTKGPSKIVTHNAYLTINGREQTLLDHIQEAREHVTSNAFSVTIVAYSHNYHKPGRENNPQSYMALEEQGDLLSLDAYDLEQIAQGNCFYLRHYDFRTTRLNDNTRSTHVGILAIGTNSFSLAFQLFMRPRNLAALTRRRS